MLILLVTVFMSAQDVSAALRGGGGNNNNDNNNKNNNKNTTGSHNNDWLKRMKQSRDAHRGIEVINSSKFNVELYWINPDNHELVLTSSPFILPGSQMAINSYVGHSFKATELPNQKTGHCKPSRKNSDGDCRTIVFDVSDNDEQRVTITKEFDAVYYDSRIHAQTQANEMIDNCHELLIDGNAEQMVECVKNGVADSLERIHEEINFQTSVRVNLADKLENYTCDDNEMESSTPIRTEQWVQPHNSTSNSNGMSSYISGIMRGAGNKGQNKNNNRRHQPELSRNVHIMLDRPSSRIHVIDNFILEDECVAMKKAAKRSLHKATVADGKGGSRYSESRKAMQAGIKVHWKAEHDADAEGYQIARLSRRVYDYTNHVLDLNIREQGQEDLMSIQYEGAGRNSTKPPDRYMPHCDGDCTGSQHKSGTRMATIVMYCAVPEDGGHTNFRNAGVHVNPKPGTGVFFSYIDPDTLLTDNGFTTHSGCPVYKGRKEIVTQWVRRGVDLENPWSSFNTLGISIKNVHSDDDDDLDFDDGEDL